MQSIIGNNVVQPESGYNQEMALEQAILKKRKQILATAFPIAAERLFSLSLIPKYSGFYLVIGTIFFFFLLPMHDVT